MLERLKQFFPQQVFIFSGDKTVAENFGKELQDSKEWYYPIFTSTLLIDHTREILGKSTDSAEKPFYLICYFETLHSDAHQLLLKTLEEPGKNKFYCLVTPHPNALPQTILSRAHVLSAGAVKSESSDFTLLQTDEQFAYITKHFSGEVESADKKSHALRLLDEFERNFSKNPSSKAVIVYETKKMLLKANLSPKQVLEFMVTALKI